MDIKKVGKDVLHDFVGMNPATAAIFGFKDIGENEILIRDDLKDTEVEQTARHEQIENDLIKSGKSYWEAHIAALSEEKSFAPEVKAMEAKIFKVYPFQIKELKDRVLEFVGSTELPDRDNEVVKASAWQFDRYTKNPVVQWAHDYSSPPIGKTLSIKQNAKKETIFQIEFADKDTYEFADTIYRLCRGGFLNATSVGFIPLEWDRGEKEGSPSRTYTKVELLEISVVPVPANPEALISARNAGVITTKEFDFVTKPEVTENLIRIPNPKDKGSHEGCKDRTMALSEKDGIQALYCVDHKIIMTYLFDKDKWDKAKAEAWVKDHSKSMTQPQIADELDYVLTSLKDVGLSPENTDIALKVLDELRRLTGSDKPEEIRKSILEGCDAITKAWEAHHEAHCKCYDTVNKGMATIKRSLENGDIGNQPSTPLGNAAQNLENIYEYLKSEIKRQLEDK